MSSNYHEAMDAIQHDAEAPSTGIRLRLQMHAFLYVYNLRPHVNDVLSYPKRIHSKMVSKVGRL